MKKLFGILLLVTLIVFPSKNLTAGDPLDVWYFWGYVYFTTDYNYRGITNSSGEPAVQGGFDYWNLPWDFGTWASSIDYSRHYPVRDYSVEFGIYGGYLNSFTIKEFELDYVFYAEYDWYPDEKHARAPLGASPTGDMWSFTLELTHTYTTALFSPTYGINLLYSPEDFGKDGKVYGLDLLARYELPKDFQLNLLYGYTDHQGGEYWTGDRWRLGLGQGLGYDYFWWKIEVGHLWQTYYLRLAYVNNSEPDYLAIKTDGCFIFNLEFGSVDYY